MKYIKIILLLATLWPLIYFLIFAQSVFELMSNSTSGFDYSLFTFHAITVTLLVGLIICYSICLYLNKVVDGNSKMLWLIGFIMLSGIVMPFYWWKHIWNNNLT